MPWGYFRFARYALFVDFCLSEVMGDGRAATVRNGDAPAALRGGIRRSEAGSTLFNSGLLLRFATETAACSECNTARLSHSDAQLRVFECFHV